MIKVTYEKRAGVVIDYIATPPRHAAGDLQEIGLHVDELMVPVPFAGEEVLQTARLEPDGAVDEAVLVWTTIIADASDKASGADFIVKNLSIRAVKIIKGKCSSQFTRPSNHRRPAGSGR